jgi:hypothetical protein
LFHIGAPGVVRTIRPRIRSLERLAPAARAGRAGRSATDYAEFRQRYWRQLGARSNTELLAQLRQLANRSPGVIVLTDEPHVEWSAAWALAELLDGENQRPPEGGRYGYVYVVELRPSGKRARPEVYVGDTHESPEERFYKHVIGHRRRRSGVRTSAECVRRRGMRLAYELFHHINPLPPPLDACERAKELRRQLEVEYDICGSPDCMEPRAKS